MNTILMANQIEHTGVINEIKNDFIQVLIDQQSACSDCNVTGICRSSDHKEKIIEVESQDNTFKVGEKVILFGKKSIGFQAVTLAFIVPFLLILITLIIFQSVLKNEVVSGVLAILILVPYYSVLSIFDKRIKTKFKFEIKKDTTE